MDTNETTTTSLALVSSEQSALAVKLDELTALAVSTTNAENSFQNVFAHAGCLAKFGEMLTDDVMAMFMPLQNRALGFLTDKRESGYPMHIVRDVIIDAAMNGLVPVGNMFNIIAGRMYVTKEGLKYLLDKVQGLSWRVEADIPKLKDGGALVKMRIEWQLENGEPQVKEKEFAVRQNSGMGADALIGKAVRKARAWLYEEVTRKRIDDGDIADDVRPASPNFMKPAIGRAADAQPGAPASATRPASAPAPAQPASATRPASAPAPAQRTNASAPASAPATAPAPAQRTNASAPAAQRTSTRRTNNGEMFDYPEQPSRSYADFEH